jgi:arylsulfatase A-like enzyme
MKRQIFAFLVTLLACASAPAASKPNILFIAVDDLRPQLGCYGDPIAKTPNLDALASRGLLFNRAYCQQAVCSPSRSSLLTGRRPDTTKIYNLEDHFRTFLPDVVTLPQHFKNNGYHAQGFGKIYHGSLDDPRSWSVPHTPSQGLAYGPKVAKAIEKHRDELRAQGITGKKLQQAAKGPAWQAAACEDNVLNDGATADKAIEAMNQVKDKPFFLAVGFVKPHLPFVAPKKYFDLYPPADQIKLPENRTRPEGAPGLAFTDFAELRSYQDMPKGNAPISDQQARELIRGYYAATSYMDAQVGRVLAELDKLGLRDNTIIILWGDHGWHLGEQGMWCKHTNFENATRAAMMISVPDKILPQAKHGVKTDALVEYVDIYPTLCELAGLELTQGLEGASFVPLISDPTRAWKSAAFSQYPRQGGQIMGYTMRTDRYRYTEWQDKQGKAVAVELYDHQSDPRETRNIASDASQAATVTELSNKLKEGWRAVHLPS